MTAEATLYIEDPNVTQTVGVVVFDGDNVVATRAGIDSRQPWGIYGLPGGEIEEGETAREAAKRELFEETGLEVELDDLVEFPGNKYQAQVDLRNSSETMQWTVYICERYTGDLRPEGRKGEKTIPERVPVTDLSLLYPTLPNVNEAILNAKNHLNNGHSKP